MPQLFQDQLIQHLILVPMISLHLHTGVLPLNANVKTWLRNEYGQQWSDIQ